MRLKSALMKLFGTPGKDYVPPPPPPPPPPPNPTVQSVFGDNPYYDDPTGVFGLSSVTVHYNPIYFATKDAAEKLCAMYGGRALVDGDGRTEGIRMNQPQWFVRFPNGNFVNAGFAISQFGYGHSRAEVDATIKEMIEYFPEA